MRTNFSWLLGSATIACAAVGSVVATLWLLGLNPNGTESTVLQAGPDSRPAVFRVPRFFAPTRDARFFFGCFLVSGVVRRERGFDAMVPLTRLGTSMACHGGRSHGRL